jgi:hypothetical protein
MSLPSVWVAMAVIGLGIAHAAVVARRPSLHVAGWPVLAQCTVIVAVLWASVFLRGPGSDFIYFQF